MTDTDRHEQKITLNATRARVWRALTDAKEFGQWFGMALEGSFVAGQPISGRLTIPNYEHLTFSFDVEKITPMDYFAIKWHPHAVEVDYDYSKDPKTLVEFTLTGKDGAIVLTVAESGFDKLPAARRTLAFRETYGGWGFQLKNIEAHVAK